MLAFGKLRQEGSELEGNLGYMGMPPQLLISWLKQNDRIEIVIRQLSGSWLDGERSLPPPVRTRRTSKIEPAGFLR